MRIDKLHLKNFRCFEDIEFEFHPNFNLIVGENGAGKSALLLALCRALDPVAAICGGVSGDPLNVDYRRVVVEENGILKAHPQPAPLVRAVWDEAGDVNEWAPDRFAGTLDGIVNRPERIAAMSRRLLELRMQARPLPLLAFFVPTRVWKAEKDGSSLEWGSLRSKHSGDGYRGWKEAGTFVDEYRNWFIREEWARWADSKRAMDESAKRMRAKVFDAAKQVSCGFILGAEDITFDVDRGKVVLRFEDGHWDDLDALSDGQRGVLSLAAELVTRAYAINDHLGDKVLSETNGVVLIDELDLHLHPRWQRSIVAKLMELFPKVQFFATTHSPVIIQEVEPSMVTMLRWQDGKVVAEKPDQTVGLDLAGVMSHVMNGAEAHPHKVATKIATIESLISIGKFDEARKEIDALQQISHGPTPESVGLEAELDSIRSLSDAPDH